MDSSDFETWLSAVRSLTAAQRGRAFRELTLAEAADFSDDEDSDLACAPATIAETESRKEPTATNSPAGTRERGTFADVAKERFARGGCPHCHSPEVRSWGGARGLPRYRCAQCHKTFNPFTGTPVAGLHNKDRWVDQAQALVEGESLAKAAERCQIHPSTPSDGGIGFSPPSTSTSPSAFRVSSKPMRPSSSSRSRGGGAAWRGPPVVAAARPPSAACRRSRFRSSWRAIAAAPRSTPSSPASTPPA